MRIPVLFLAAIAFACGNSKADISGTVLDPSGRPIEGARVECGPTTVYTNNEGLFAISNARDCAATIAKAGFALATAQLHSGNRAQIAMQLAGPTETVVVTATRAETTPEQAGVAASAMTARDFDLRDDPTVADVLREIPGLQITNYSRRGGLTEVFTRGADSTSTLVLLDGVPLNDPGGELNMAHLSSSEFDRVEVVRGPESALFGAEASGGAIQLFTKRGDPEKRRPHITASYERGNFGTDRWTAGVSGGSGAKIDYSFNAEQLHTAGEYQNDFYRDTTGTANIGYRLSAATQIRGVFSIYDAHAGTPNQVGYGIVDSDANEETRDSTVTFTIDDTRTAHYFQHAWFGYNRLRDRFNDAVADSYDVGALGSHDSRAAAGDLSRPGPRAAVPNPAARGIAVCRVRRHAVPVSLRQSHGARYRRVSGDLRAIGWSPRIRL